MFRFFLAIRFVLRRTRGSSYPATVSSGLTGRIERLLIWSFGEFQRHRRRPSTPVAVDSGSVIIGARLSLGNGPLLENKLVSLSRDDRRRHVYVLGATGAGKTTLLLKLIDADLAAGKTIVLIDLRGDLVDRVLPRMLASRPAKEWAGRFCLIDLRQDEHIVGINPLAGVQDPAYRALHVLSVLRRESSSWGVQLDETARNSLLALSAVGGSLLDVEPLLCDRAFRTQVLAQVTDVQVKRFFQRYDELSPERLAGWFLPVLNKISPIIAIEPFRLMLGSKRSIDFVELLDRPGQVVLIALAVHRFHNTARLIGSLLVSAIQLAAVSRADRPEADRNSVTLVLDEFEGMATEDFLTVVAECRRFGLSLTLAHQNCSQLDVKLRHALRNIVCSQFFFQTGAIDANQLANEIAVDLPKEDLRSLLMSQAIGEAVLVRRGQAPVRVGVDYSSDPVVTDAELNELKQIAYRDFGQPSAAVARSIAMGQAPVSEQPREIRHDRKPKLS